jgi:hypothetical protein
MALGALHRSLDLLAVWTEDLLRRRPQPCRLAPAQPLDCFGPLPALPEPPVAAGPWSAPSPRPLRVGDRMPVRVTLAQGALRGTALLVPPWKIGSPGLVSGYARLLARAGWEVWLVTLPHHLERTLHGSRSGEDFASLDLFRLRAVFEQLVTELRVLATLAGRRGPVGVVGLSLGGLAGALAATAPERLDLVALIAPAQLSLVMAETGIGRRYRRLAVRSGGGWPGDEALAAALRPFDARLRQLTARRLFVAAGLQDQISPRGGRWGWPRPGARRPTSTGAGTSACSSCAAPCAVTWPHSAGKTAQWAGKPPRSDVTSSGGDDMNWADVPVDPSLNPSRHGSRQIRL